MRFFTAEESNSKVFLKDQKVGNDLAKRNSGARFTRKIVVTKIVTTIVTKSNFDSVTCVNYSFSPLS